jgi:hypothetical protein
VKRLAFLEDVRFMLVDEHRANIAVFEERVGQGEGGIDHQVL